MTSESGDKPLPLSAAKPPEPEQLPCPRCDSTDTKFCYYNNYNLAQPRHFCRACRRYWTRGGSLRNIPVGGTTRKNTTATTNKRPRNSTAATTTSPLPSGHVLGNPVIPGIKAETMQYDVNLNETGHDSFANLLGFGIGSGYREMGFGLAGGDWEMERVGAVEDGSGSGSGATWQLEGECFGWPDLAISTLGWGPKE